MKIAFILPSLINKGPIIVAHTIIKNIIDKVEKIDVYYFDDNFALDFPCSTYKLSMNVAIDFDSYDIIHTHGLRPDRYIHKWKKNIKKTKTVTTIHADIAQDFKYGYNKLVSLIFTPIWLKLMANHDSIAVISEKLKDLYKNKFKNIYRVYNGVDIYLEEFSINQNYVDKINELKERELVIIGSYAAINKRKGIDQIVRLLATRDDLSLVFIGEGKEINNLQYLAQSLGVADRLVFLPYTLKPYGYVHLFDIYAMPSRSEGFGLALVEAALTKASIICSDIPVFHEIFNEDEVSYFRLEDMDSLNVAVSEALNKRSLKSNNAFEKAKKFSGEIMGANYLDFYNKVLQ